MMCCVCRYDHAMLRDAISGFFSTLRGVFLAGYEGTDDMLDEDDIAYVGTHVNSCSITGSDLHWAHALKLTKSCEQRHASHCSLEQSRGFPYR